MYFITVDFIYLENCCWVWDQRRDMTCPSNRLQLHSGLAFRIKPQRILTSTQHSLKIQKPRCENSVRIYLEPSIAQLFVDYLDMSWTALVVRRFAVGPLNFSPETFLFRTDYRQADPSNLLLMGAPDLLAEVAAPRVAEYRRSMKQINEVLDEAISQALDEQQLADEQDRWLTSDH